MCLSYRGRVSVGPAVVRGNSIQRASTTMTEMEITNDMDIDKVEIDEVADDEMYERDFVTLISGDGMKFEVSKEAAKVSGTLNNMINSEFSETLNGEIRLPEIDGAVLEKVVEYLYYNLKNRDRGKGSKSAEIEDFDIPTEMALEILVAADYLQV